MKKYIVSICLGMFLFASCSNWLDVKPKTTVEEEEVFRLKQITGIAEIFKNKAYSKSWEMLEVDDE